MFTYLFYAIYFEIEIWFSGRFAVLYVFGASDPAYLCRAPVDYLHPFLVSCAVTGCRRGIAGQARARKVAFRSGLVALSLENSASHIEE